MKLPPLELEHTFHRAIDTSLPSGADFAEPGQETLIDPPDHYIANPESSRAARSETSPSTAVRSD